MPELVANGPDIPAHLLNELDDDRVVFFCGAGVSAGPGSDLPGFAGLVRNIYRAAAPMETDEVELAALNLNEVQFKAWLEREEVPEDWLPRFDKALELLERPDRLGAPPKATILRKTVIEELSTSPTGELRLHRALIDLAKNEHGTRLVTTNFDNRFVEAGLDEGFVDVAPKLPVPKPDDWSSLVHLHGRILPDDSDGSNLVLTAADFGRAYLTNGWAARFVTELFREFTVVFVGYSVSDPVMGYMMDALAAEGAKGGRDSRPYAFAAHGGAEHERQSVEHQWQAKNVEPVLYDGRDGHALLTDTLSEWARIRQDPSGSRARIAVEGISRMPNDLIAKQVAWALESPAAAEALANAPPIEDEADFPKIEAWLDIFAGKGLLQCSADDAKPKQGDEGPASLRLVDNGLHLRNPGALDTTRKHLARWMARHLHVPQLLAWVLRKGGHVHPGLRQQILIHLAKEEPKPAIPERLRVLWTVLLDHEAADRWSSIWTSGRYCAAVSDPERHRIEEAIIERIAPRLVVRPGLPPGRGHLPAVTPIETCGYLKLAAGDDDDRGLASKILESSDALVRHAETLTAHLERALLLPEEDDYMRLFSFLLRPSIADHRQNHNHDVWNKMIDFARNSYFALAATKRRRADNLLLRWVESEQPLFRRLALHALTENPRSDIHLAQRLLVAGRKPGLWEFELHREALRFLRLAGGRLPRSLRTAIVRAIHSGPRPGQRKNLDEARLRREKALRLHKLSVSGARLDRKSAALASEAAPVGRDDVSERDEFRVWSDEPGFVADEEFAPEHLVQGSVDEVMAALDQGEVSEDCFRGLLARKETKIAAALRWLAEQGKWPARYWEWLLWHLARPVESQRSATRRYRHAACILARAPGFLFGQVGASAAHFISRLAEEYSVEREAEFSGLWMKAWIGKKPGGTDAAYETNPLTTALNHPAGILAEAALTRLGKNNFQAGGEIPNTIRPYFEEIGMDREGHLGRVMLMTRLQYLFWIDRDWTKEHLIIRLEPPHSREARDLWSAFSWSPRLNPNLLRAIKESFLEYLKSERKMDEGQRNLTNLFVTVCLDAPEELTVDQIRSVIARFSEDSLAVVLWCLAMKLTGTAEERSNIWHEKILPWLTDYWPRAGSRNTKRTSKAIIGMLEECGPAFPEAARWSLEFLRPIQGERLDLYGLIQSGYAQQYPDAILDVLDRIAVADMFPDYERQFLRGLLEQAVMAKSSLQEDNRYRKLFRIASG